MFRNIGPQQQILCHRRSVYPGSPKDPPREADPFRIFFVPKTPFFPPPRKLAMARTSDRNPDHLPGEKDSGLYGMTANKVYPPPPDQSRSPAPRSAAHPHGRPLRYQAGGDHPGCEPPSALISAYLRLRRGTCALLGVYNSFMYFTFRS